MPPTLDRQSEILGYLHAGAAPTRSIPVHDLDPNGLPARGFHVRFNEYELRLMQVFANIDSTSKQRIVRGALREYLKKRMKNEGLPFHPSASTRTTEDP